MITYTNLFSVLNGRYYITPLHVRNSFSETSQYCLLLSSSNNRVIIKEISRPNMANSKNIIFEIYFAKIKEAIYFEADDTSWKIKRFRFTGTQAMSDDDIDTGLKRNFEYIEEEIDPNNFLPLSIQNELAAAFFNIIS